MDDSIQNPGSALGEAIGAQMEQSLNRLLKGLIEDKSYHFLSEGVSLKKTKKSQSPKKLLLYYQAGTAYNIDAVIANEVIQPIILIESKYIRYKKHNRDKGSWICTAHPAVRRRYASIRSSIAILAGNWSKTSLAMIRSYDINVHLIPFESICDFLKVFDIKFDWEEKDRDTAVDSWNRYEKLSEEEQQSIGDQMVGLVRDALSEQVLGILDDNAERKIDRTTIELHSNLGEVNRRQFPSTTEAVDFLTHVDPQKAFQTEDSVTLFDPPPTIDD